MADIFRDLEKRMREEGYKPSPHKRLARKRKATKKNPTGFSYGDRVHVQATDQNGDPLRGVFVVLGHAARGAAPGIIVQAQGSGKIYIVDHAKIRKANPSRVADAEKFFEDFHWGVPATKKKQVRVPSAAGQALVELGEMTAVAYKTNKAGKTEEFEHKFKRPRPVLAMDEEENLHVVGGGYSVEDRGIVD